MKKDEIKDVPFDWGEAIPNGLRPGQLLPADTMQRARHAKFLTDFLITKAGNTSYVLNVNAGWGAGKTYFLKRWKHEISGSFPAVYIDAWSNDHSHDPLLHVVSNIRNYLTSLKYDTPLEQKLFQGMFKLLKNGAPAIAKNVITKVLENYGVDIKDAGGVFDNMSLAEMGSKLAENAIKDHEEAAKGAEAIKKSILNWLESVVKEDGDLSLPFFIFIDELDRCRPTYAIEMLETVKHIFDMENVVFIIATDKDQLQHSIRAVYGAGFDARLYLDRFFNRTVTLSEVSRYGFIKEKLKCSNALSSYCEDESNFPYDAYLETRMHDLHELLTIIADGFNMPLRTVDLWFDRFEAAISTRQTPLELNVLAFLMGLEAHDPEALTRLMNGNLTLTSSQAPGGNNVKFRSTGIIISWRFSMINSYDYLINDNNDYGRSQDKRTSQIAFIKYVELVIAAVRFKNEKLQDNAIKIILENYSEVRKGNHPTEKTYDGNNIFKYHVAVTEFVYLFHHKHNVTLKNYYDLCKLATHLN